MNAKSLIPLVAGLVIAGVAAKLGLDFIKKAEGKQAKVVQLWTPTQDVKRGVSIDETMLRPLEYPAELAPPGALSNREQILGRVPHTGAPAGLPILNSMLLPPGEHAGLQVPPGFRAVAVKIDESSGVDNHLEPGCHVDVVGMFTVRGGSRAETIARTILEDVEVAAVGQRLTPTTPGSASEKDRTSSRRDRPARAVTLLVRPEQVPTLHLAEQKGKIKLCMRGVSDSSHVTRNVRVDEDDLLGPQDSKPAPEQTWGDKVAQLVGTLSTSDQPQPGSEEPPASVAPLSPRSDGKWVWVMAVQNGNERRVLAWRGMDDIQPTEIGSPGRQSVFEDTPRLPPPQPPTIEFKQESQADPPQSGETGSQPDPDGVPEIESEIESEPEELFE